MVHAQSSVHSHEPVASGDQPLDWVCVSVCCRGRKVEGTGGGGGWAIEG